MQTKDRALMENKNLQLERLVFFSDAVVAIAITLLVIDLKIDHTATGHLTMHDIQAQWKLLLAFLLSFLNIANFWKNHHTFFVYIKKIDERLLWFNIIWLFFIVLLPFSTSLVSGYFSDYTSIFIYSVNMLMVSCFQNMIWDYASLQPEFMHDNKGEMDEEIKKRIRLFCNLEMVNAAVAVGLSFVNPKLAFILLFTKLPMIVLARMYYQVNKKPQKRV